MESVPQESVVLHPPTREIQAWTLEEIFSFLVLGCVAQKKVSITYNTSPKQMRLAVLKQLQDLIHKQRTAFILLDLRYLDAMVMNTKLPLCYWNLRTCLKVLEWSGGPQKKLLPCSGFKTLCPLREGMVFQIKRLLEPIFPDIWSPPVYHSLLPCSPMEAAAAIPKIQLHTLSMMQFDGRLA